MALAHRIAYLNKASKQAAELSVDASARGDQIQAWQHSIDLLREHMRHQPNTPLGKAAHERAERNITLLRAYIARAKRKERIA